MADESKEVLVSLTEESLKKLLNKSFRNGVLAGLQTMLETMEKNITPEHFSSEEMKSGFDMAKLLIGAAYAQASISLIGDDV